MVSFSGSKTDPASSQKVPVWNQMEVRTAFFSDAKDVFRGTSLAKVVSMLWILESLKTLRSVHLELIRNLIITLYVLAVLAICATVKASEVSGPLVVGTEAKLDSGINGGLQLPSFRSQSSPL